MPNFSLLDLFRVGAPVDDANRQPTLDASDVILADGSAVGQVGTTMSKWADGFAGAALDSTLWDVVRNVGSMAVSVSNGQLTVAMGTASGDEVLLVGRQDLTLPANLTACLTMSQRIAGNEVRFGYLEVDSAGAPVVHSTPANGFRNFAALRLSGTTNTVGVLETCYANGAVKSSANMTLAQASNLLSDYSIEARPEDCTAASQAADSVSARATGGARLSSVTPDPNKLYRPFLWLRNVSAPATSTSVVVSHVTSLDIQELQAEVGGGRGNAVASQASPVTVVNGLPASTNSIGTVVVGNALASATANGATPSVIVSAATTNPTSVKASAGKVVGGTAGNTTASYKYLRFYNKASAPTVGTDTPTFVVPIPPNDTKDLAAIFDQYGLSCATGIALAITGGSALLDATAVAAGDVVVSLLTV